MASPYLIQQDHYAIRLLEDQPADYSWLAKWLTDPMVLTYYKGRDNPFPLERVRKKYVPRVQRLHPTVPCFMLDRDQPIGYLQYYPLSAAERAEFTLLTAANPFGMDLFIGEPTAWNRGLGTIRPQSPETVPGTTSSPSPGMPTPLRCTEYSIPGPLSEAERRICSRVGAETPRRQQLPGPLRGGMKKT